MHDVVDIRPAILLPSLNDVNEIILSENPLKTARDLFLKSKSVFRNSSNNLTNKELKLLNELGIKLMETLDSVCSASDERRMLIKEINVFCDLVEDSIKKNTERKHFKCQFCSVGFITERELLEHVNKHASESSQLPEQICVQCQDPFIFSSEFSLCLDCTKQQVEDTADNVSASVPRKTKLNKTLQMYKDPNNEDCDVLSKKTLDKTTNIRQKMEKVRIAPGEFGKFHNWGEDIFLEEKCFPHLYPFGCGGYLSTNADQKDTHKGFSSYVRQRIMSADSKYRQDYVYLFFLLLVKELVQLKRCKMTFLRQARKLTNLTKDEVMNTDKIDLPRYNRSFEVFKTMRGTSMYYQDAKKNLMAVLRQNGCPSLFLTVSSAEYKWKQLIKQILETEWKQEVSMAYVE